MPRGVCIAINVALSCLAAVMAWSAMPATTLSITRMNSAQPRAVLIDMSVPDDIGKSGYLVWELRPLSRTMKCDNNEPERARLGRA